MGPPSYGRSERRAPPSLTHYRLDGAGEELDGIGAMRFVARTMTRQVDQQRAAIGVVIERLLAAPEGEIANPAMDEYQRFAPVP